MCQALALSTGSLPASKTHKTGRRWAFLPSADVTSPSLGTLTIVNSKRDTASYGLAIEDGQVLFAKADGTEVYGVTVTRTGVPTRCTCDGFHFTRKCKHITAAAALIEEGVLPLQVMRPLATVG